MQESLAVWKTKQIDICGIPDDGRSARWDAGTSVVNDVKARARRPHRNPSLVRASPVRTNDQDNEAAVLTSTIGNQPYPPLSFIR